MISVVNIDEKMLVVSLDSWVYSIPLDSNWMTVLEELADGGYRTPKHGVNILGPAKDFEYIVNNLKRGNK